MSFENAFRYALTHRVISGYHFKSPRKPEMPKVIFLSNQGNMIMHLLRQNKRSRSMSYPCSTDGSDRYVSI